METIDKKLFCYTISSKENLTQIFQLIKTKINSNYQNLEKRELVYNSVIDGYKFFLDVRDEVNLNLDDTMCQALTLFSRSLNKDYNKLKQSILKE